MGAAMALIIAKMSQRNTERDEERFRAMAAEIFSQNTRQMQQDNEQRLSDALGPIKENFNEFRRAFNESYSREARERYSLQENIRQLIELNDAIGREARDLTNALKGNTRVQGQWGEMILQNILERSGLREGEEYALQTAANNAEGDRLRPDAVISFPDGRKLVVDAKTSLKAYMELAETPDPARQKMLARSHVISVKNHIIELRDKNYQAYVGDAKIDFVLMFIPNEGAYLAAMQADPALWQFAYDNRVVIVSPTHLMSVVKLVEQTWMHDRQNRNALEIAREGGMLIDKLCGFVADLEKIQSSLSSAQKAYEAALIKLNGRGGIISRAEKLQALGAKATKKIPSISNE